MMTLIVDVVVVVEIHNVDFSLLSDFQFLADENWLSDQQLVNLCSPDLIGFLQILGLCRPVVQVLNVRVDSIY